MQNRRQQEAAAVGEPAPPCTAGFGDLGSLAPCPPACIYCLYIRKGNTCHPVARQFVKIPPRRLRRSHIAPHRLRYHRRCGAARRLPLCALTFLPSRPHKLNGHGQGAQRTRAERFYEIYIRYIEVYIMKTLRSALLPFKVWPWRLVITADGRGYTLRWRIW